LVLVVVGGVEDSKTRGVAVFEEFVGSEVVRSREILETEVATNVVLVAEGNADVFLAVPREEVHDFALDEGVDDAVQEPPLFGVDEIRFVVEDELEVGVGLTDAVPWRKVVS
jgi:hypothetical protein